jgi:hypothetical protein
MADITVLKKSIRPMPGAMVVRRTAGGTVNLGDGVYTAADGDAEQTDADAAASAQLFGICVGVPDQEIGVTAAAAGDPIDVVILGHVTGFSGMTPGDLLFVSANAGLLADAAPASGDYIWVAGEAVSATEILVRPFTYDVVVVP